MRRLRTGLLLALLMVLCGCSGQGVNTHLNDTLVAYQQPVDSVDGAVHRKKTITWGNGIIQMVLCEVTYDTEENAQLAYEILPMRSTPTLEGRTVSYYEDETQYANQRLWYDDMAELLEAEGWTIQTEENITFVGVIEEIHDAGILVSTQDEVGFDRAMVGYHETLSVGFNFVEGQRVRITILPQVRESYPVQVTAVQILLAGEAEPAATPA